MLTTHAGPLDTIWDDLLPDFVRILPDDLARLDQLLDSPRVLKQFERHWGRARLNVGRPSIPMATYVRLMTLKHRHRWGYERLVRQVGDSLHLRRFCRISLVDDVPHESTVRKLTRRLGPELVDDLTREVVRLAVEERGFRVRALRCDSTVQEADIRYPTDCDLAADAVRVLVRSAGRVRATIPELDAKVRDRTRAVGHRVRELGRSLRRRTGEAKEDVQRLTEEVAGLAKATLGQTRRLLGEAEQVKASGYELGGRAARAVADLEEMIRLGDKVVEQIRRRFSGEKISERLVSLHDPDARPIRKGKRPNPNQFGYMTQYAELTAHTRRGAPGLLLPPKTAIGSAHEDALLPQTVAEMLVLDLRPQEAVFDGGFSTRRTLATMAPLGSRVFISGRAANEGSRRTRQRLASHRVGCEGRISHLKREYGAGRSRLRGENGARTWAGWSALTYDLDTVARLPINDIGNRP